MTVDFAEAARWHEIAIERGERLSYGNLGYLYTEGKEGVPKDYDKARDLLERGRDAGDAMSINNLAWLYENGWGVEQDYVKARDLYQQAYDLGLDFAKGGLDAMEEVLAGGGTGGTGDGGSDGGGKADKIKN